MKCTEPSAKAKFAPPGWKLDADSAYESVYSSVVSGIFLKGLMGNSAVNSVSDSTASPHQSQLPESPAVNRPLARSP